MLGGKNRYARRGYTIVEVMIVLAVSGLMFLVAANFINGKQERAAFSQGTSDLNGQLQGIVEDVTDGHYSDVPLYCYKSGGSLIVQTTNPTGQQLGQGSNQDCVFLGKLIHFYKSGTSQPQNYQIFSLADARSASGSLPNAYVTAVSYLTASGAISQGAYVSSMVVHSSSGDDAAAYNIGFTQGLGAIDPASGDYQNGAQNISLIYATSASLDNSGAAAWSAASVKGAVVQPAQYATICLSDGRRHAKLVVGDANNGSQFNISITQQGQGAACT